MRIGRVLHLAYRDEIAHLLTLPLPGRSPVVFSGRNDHPAGVFGESNTQERDMALGSFETPDSEDIEIDADDVVSLSADEEEGTTVIELEDGDEVTVVATQLEVAAELGSIRSTMSIPRMTTMSRSRTWSKTRSTRTNRAAARAWRPPPEVSTLAYILMRAPTRK